MLDHTPDQDVISQTASWISKVVMGLAFCPFAAKVFRNNSIRYTVSRENGTPQNLQLLRRELLFLEQNKATETSFIIFPAALQDFRDYLRFVTMAEQLLQRKPFKGKYQAASFHPLYVFNGSTPDDPANYTNRSVYPMLHLLREGSVSQALKHYEDAAGIPENNIKRARGKGLEYMSALLASCRMP